MTNNSSSESHAQDDSHWPTASMLAYGTFGGRSPAGRRFHFRCFVALAAMALWFLFGAPLRPHTPKSVLDIVTALVPGASFAYIAREFRRYLSALDELARRIQVESIAWTYLCGLAVAMLLGGIGLVYDWRFNAAWFIVLEPVRAGWLYFVARRYQ